MWDFVKKVGRAIGRGVSGALSWVFNGVGWFIHRIFGIPELIFSLLGWRLKKYLHLQVRVLLDRNNKPLVNQGQVDYVVSAAKQALRQRANIRIVPPRNSPMVETISDPSPEWVMSVKCNGGAFKQSFRRVGRWLRMHANQDRSVVTIFVVEDIQGKNGCFLGAADYGMIDLFALPDPGGDLEEGRALILAHELGHGCDLLHRKNPRNLMRRTYVTRTGHMTNWQVSVLRSSRNVRYFN